MSFPRIGGHEDALCRTIIGLTGYSASREVPLVDALLGRCNAWRRDDEAATELNGKTVSQSQA